MDILLRRIDASALKIIDEKAKNNRMTRNELLKRHIEELAQFDGVKLAEKELNTTMKSVEDALEMTYKRLDQLEKQSTKMYLLLSIVLDIDPKEVDDYLEGMFYIK